MVSAPEDTSFLTVVSASAEVSPPDVSTSFPQPEMERVVKIVTSNKK